jgi:hypothetical protein
MGESAIGFIGVSPTCAVIVISDRWHESLSQRSDVNIGLLQDAENG